MHRYQIVHSTEYDYSETVSVSHHLARLTPRNLSCQRCVRHSMVVDPAPDVLSTHVDYFGNASTAFTIQDAHARLTVHAASLVEVDPPASRGHESLAWETAADRSRLPLDAIECVFDPSGSPVDGVFLSYACTSFAARRPLLDAVSELTARIHADFTFDPRATTVTTPLDEVYRTRRGVCQDFARLEIACLRALGLPARYVSGYLETVPPPDGPRLVGSDASHAWVSFFCPGIGWIDVDPTNNMFPGGSHVTLAWGREYDDVSPLRGVILGGGAHRLSVRVDVVRA